MHVTRSDLELSDLDAVRSLLHAEKPELIINCAAYTNVDAAETNEEVAFAVNAAAVGEMAGWAEDAGARFVTFSTDYVFDGSKSRPWIESDALCPINAYGRSKAAGERLIRGLSRSLIVRTSWVISGTHRNFVSVILGAAAKGPLKVVDDQHGCPTVAADLARATMTAVEAEATGLLHLVNEEPTTWFGLAQAALESAGMDPSLAQPCTSEEYPRPAPRPRNSVLGSERLAELGLERLPHWRDALADVVSGLRG